MNIALKKACIPLPNSSFYSLHQAYGHGSYFEALFPPTNLGFKLKPDQRYLLLTMSFNFEFRRPNVTHQCILLHVISL